MFGYKRTTILFAVLTAHFYQTPGAFAANSVSAPSFASQSSLARRANADGTGHQVAQPSTRKSPETTLPAVPSSAQAPNYPAHFGKVQPLNEPNTNKWPKNVFKVGKVDVDMLSPGELRLGTLTPSSLVPLGHDLNLFNLDASYTRTLTLRETLQNVVDYNLPIRISSESVQAAKWRYYASIGKFLPDWENEYQDQAQNGALSINAALFLKTNNPFIFTRTGLRQYVFRGGSVVNGFLRQKNLFRASKFEHHTVLSDALLETTKRYYATLLEDALLEIRSKTVAASDALLIQNDWLKAHGILTKLEVLQAKAQVARDKQSLIHEQIARRSAAIKLASYMNVPASINFLLSEKTLKKVPLISEKMTPTMLLNVAMIHRPELHSLEHQRIAARRAIAVAGAPLMPRVSVFMNAIGSGSTLSQSYTNIAGGFAPVALAGSPTSANVLGPTSLPLPPVVVGASEVGPGTRNVYQTGAVYTAPQQVSKRIRSLLTAGFNAEWTVTGLGVVDTSEMNALKAEARQASLRCNDEIIKVSEEVRTSFLNSIDAESQIDQTTIEVTAAEEELRFAQARLVNGVGTDVDVINAQRDYTVALINKAQAIIAYNVAQVHLLRDIGLISVDNLCSGKLITSADISPRRQP